MKQVLSQFIKHQLKAACTREKQTQKYFVCQKHSILITFVYLLQHTSDRRLLISYFHIVCCKLKQLALLTYYEVDGQNPCTILACCTVSRT